ncbi:MAG: class II fructose-bisphosphate aldolase [Thermomicrobiales bacterium]
MPVTSMSARQMLRRLDGIVNVRDGGVAVHDEAALAGPLVDQLARDAAFGSPRVREAARWLLWACAQAVGVYPASIHDLYLAAGQDAYAHATTPAINVRGLAYDMARAVIRAAQRCQTTQVIFEISLAELDFTDQEPAEFASVVLAAALREGYRGPIFLQGDHQQINAGRYRQHPEAELSSLRQAIAALLHAGFYNIDIDASTLVDLDRPTEAEQQTLNYRHTAELTAFIREREPAGITVSVGGEIGEVGGRDSTVADLDAFMTGYQAALRALGGSLPGISKISVQTGTTHGGVALPDGTLAEVKLNLAALAELSARARRQYGLGGVVQHGASTLPEAAFDQLAARNAVEVHLATAFTTLIFEQLPEDLRQEMDTYLLDYHADERKPGQTDQQFLHATRKKGFGPFKARCWDLPPECRDAIGAALEARFMLLFDRLGVAGNRALVARYITPTPVAKPLPLALQGALAGAAPVDE